MADFKLESWEREPLWIRLLTPFLRKMRFPRLEDTAEPGKWYRYYTENCSSGIGEPAYCSLKLGKENKLMIFFAGGGLSWNEYTAARPSSIYAKDIQDTYYMTHLDLFSDIRRNRGIFEDSERNPFRDWNVLYINYDTGDFHIGNGDFPYIALDGSKRLLHHHGYKKYRASIEKMKELAPNPEAVIVCGCSGGGFGAALLTDDIMDVYDGCNNFTCLVDSGFFPMEGWDNIARDVWHAPEKIASRLHTDNITLDALKALKKERGDRVKILITSSVRDSGLSRMFNLVKNGSFSFSEDSGELFKAWLGNMKDMMCDELGEVGMYFFHIPDPAHKKEKLTIHCIIGDSRVFDHKVDGISCSEWIDNAIGGKIQRVGLDLL